MSIKVRCGECETVLNVSDKAAGKAVLCRSCGARVRVPIPEGVPVESETAPKSQRRRPSRPPADVGSESPDDLFQNLSFERIEDTKRKVCPSCATPVHVDDIECPKCGVTIATGTLSARQRMLRTRKGPPPNEFYGAIWGDGWKFLKKHWGYAGLTAVVWSITLAMSLSCLYAHHWYVTARTKALLESAKADQNIRIDGDQLIITVPDKGKARYDDKLYTNKGTYRLPAPHLAGYREPPALFWMGMSIVFQLGFGGWAWMLAVKIADVTMSGQKRIKRFQVDFFGNLTMGFRFYFWPVIVMLPVVWIGPLLISLGYRIPGGVITAVTLLLPMLLFLPAAVVQMSQRYTYRAWLLGWMARDFAMTAAPSLYVGLLMSGLVLLIPAAAIGAIAATWQQLVPWATARNAEILEFLAKNFLDLGEGNIRFLFYELPVVFGALFLAFGVLFLLISAQSIFMMRVLGLFGVYFRPDLALVSEFPDRAPAGFGPRFLAFLIDTVILALLLIPASLAGYFSGFMFMFYGFDQAGAAMQKGVYVLASLLFWGFYFASGESGQARATLGKWSMGLLVLREDDRPLTRKEAIARAAAGYLTVLTLFVGFLMSFVRSDHRALHDLITKSKVVWRGEENS